MKTKLLPNQLAWLLVLLLPTACHKSTDDPAAALPCTLSGSTYASQDSNGGKSNAAATYTFDAEGNLLRRTETYESIGSFGSKSKYITEYRYDSRGFLIESVDTDSSKYSSAGSNPTSTTSFSYTDDRLTKAVQKRTSSGTSSTSTETLQYDTQGKLAQYIAVSGTGSDVHHVVYSFSGGVLQNVNSDGKNLYQIENGRIVATQGDTYSTTRYEYDGQSRLVRSTTTGTGYKSVRTVEYEPMGHRLESALPELQFKGIPFDQLRGFYGNEDGLVKRETYTSESNGKVTSTEETTYAYQLNAKGYPLSETIKTTSVYTDPSGAQPPINSTNTTTLQLSYQTCN